MVLACQRRCNLRPVSESGQRILDTAYDLFSHRGIGAVGVNELIERADVAKATFYRHFLAIFDLFSEWFADDDCEGCSFGNVLFRNR